MKLNFDSECCCGMQSGTNGDNCERCQLSANAPAMLEALKKIVRYMEANQGKGTTVWYVASEAIKEATEVR